MNVADSSEVFVFFATAIVILIPINIVATIIIHILFSIINSMAANEKVPAFADELDKLIELKSMRNGYYIFIIGFAFAMIAVVLGFSPTTMFIILYVSGFISDVSGTSHHYICIREEFNMKKCHIHNNIRKLRFTHNEMTQQQLADIVGVTRQTIVSIEKGNYSPSLELAFRIARHFNLTIEEVFTFEEE